MLPCFACGKTLRNAFGECDNQPEEGTEFRTYGHYGSSFWDSFDGEQLVLNVCDECLRAHTDRLAQQKRYLPLKHPLLGMVGKQWIERPMVPYTGCRDDTDGAVSTEDLGRTLAAHVEWAENIAELRRYALRLEGE